jgi:hypothetical protein
MRLISQKQVVDYNSGYKDNTTLKHRNGRWTSTKISLYNVRFYRIRNVVRVPV